MLASEGLRAYSGGKSSAFSGTSSISTAECVVKKIPSMASEKRERLFNDGTKMCVVCHSSLPLVPPQSS